MKKKLLFCGLLCGLCLVGCGKRELLNDKLDASAIDKIVVTMAVGNPSFGAEQKVITDVGKVQDLVFLFNHAVVDERVDREDEWEAESGSYTFFSGEEQVLKLNCNANDPERIWINDAFYEIDYPDDLADRDWMYSHSDTMVMNVEGNGNLIKCPVE